MKEKTKNIVPWIKKEVIFVKCVTIDFDKAVTKIYSKKLLLFYYLLMVNRLDKTFVTRVNSTSKNINVS